MADIRISELPQAGSITGAELVPIVQNGQTVQTTTGAIAASPTQTQTFLTVTQESTLPNSRYFGVGLGLGYSDAGIQGLYQIYLDGTSASLENASTGIIVKSGVDTITPRQIAVSGNGLSISNGTGVSGNPTISLTGLASSIAGLSGNGLISLVSGTYYQAITLTGTADQIDVTNGTGGGNPTFSIADNVILGGTSGMTVPKGTLGQRGTGVEGKVRYNTTAGRFEGYTSSGWTTIGSGDGTVQSVGATAPASGFTISGSPITTSGTLVFALNDDLLALENQSGTGLVARTADSTYAQRTITGTSSQITVSNGSGVSGNPTIAIASNAELPGSSAIRVPYGTTADRTGSPANGMIRYNTDLGLFEGYINGSWQTFSSGSSGVTSVATGTGLTGGPITSTGTISIADTGVTANTYGSASAVPVIAINAQGQITSATNTTISITASNISDAGDANGIATLDAGGTVPLSQIPASIIGGLIYQGTWNASTNTPTLTSSVGTKGYYYVVSVAGTTNLDGITDWNVGDLAVFNGSVWEQIDNTDAVTSVNGYTGTVVLTYSDVGAANAGANTNITSMSGLTGGIATPEYIDFDTSNSVARATGRLWWDNSDGIQTLNLGMAGSNATMQIGEETYYRIKCSSAITEGQVVMFTGTVGASGGLTGAPATGLTASTASYIMGVATESGALNDWIYITAFGLVRGIDTTGGAEAWVNGQILYYDPSVAGGLTKTAPSAPNAKVQVCAVVYANANGSLFIRPTFGGALGQYEGDVGITSATTNDLLRYDTNKWVNTPASSVTVGTATTATNLAGGSNGYIPYQTGAGTTSFINAGLTSAPSNGQLMIGNGTGFTLANITAGSNISVTNTSGGIQIDATGGVTVDDVIALAIALG